MDVAGLFDALQSHAMSMGIFERVNTHEPKSNPGNGLTASITVDSIDPVSGASGLSSVSIRIVFRVRIMSSMFQEPQDGIDPNVLSAVDQLMRVYVSDFTLGGKVRNVDVFGQTRGNSLSARAGYVEIDRSMKRAMDIMLPVIVNDVWDEEA